MRRKLPRNSYPSMIGMFQSSRIASGNPRLQTSSAFSPSSASMILKSRPSRMRLATFRMTLESSTTRHVLISASASWRKGTFHCNSSLRTLQAILRRQHVGYDFEHAIDVEHDHQLALEAMYAAGEFCHARIEIDGIFLPSVIGESQDLADLIDQEAIGFAAQVDADRHRQLAVFVLRQAETGAHVHHGDDAAAQVQDSGDLPRRQWHTRQPLRHEHILDTRDRQPEQLAADHGGDVFGDGSLNGFGPAGHALILHGVRLNCFMPPG